MFREHVADFVFFLIWEIQVNVCVGDRILIQLHMLFSFVRYVFDDSRDMDGTNMSLATFGMDVVWDLTKHFGMG